MIAKVIEMEKIVEQTLLYDFYGELLTEHQQNIYEDVILNDYSLSEVAKEQGISRQGVHDMIKRCSKTLNEYEEKLHLVEKFVSIREKVHSIHELTRQYEKLEEQTLLKQIEQISNEILEEL
ncbi:MAG: YlxM family DNA-binding protein [Lachnospiraceae bacterium]|nr:YlxM family DNA-binding protein [Lachnospiraceae bacterium]MDD3614882.1 YlxM family DNA-binding protein [Lachnospiraceae bacterium]